MASFSGKLIPSSFPALQHPLFAYCLDFKLILQPVIHYHLCCSYYNWSSRLKSISIIVSKQRQKQTVQQVGGVRAADFKSACITCTLAAKERV